MKSLILSTALALAASVAAADTTCRWVRHPVDANGWMRTGHCDDGATGGFRTEIEATEDGFDIVTRVSRGGAEDSRVSVKAPAN